MKTAEASGAVSANVPGLPVHTAVENRAKAERAIRTVLTAYLEAHPGQPAGCVCAWPPKASR